MDLFGYKIFHWFFFSSVTTQGMAVAYAKHFSATSKIYYKFDWIVNEMNNANEKYISELLVKTKLSRPVVS